MPVLVNVPKCKEVAVLVSEGGGEVGNILLATVSEEVNNGVKLPV